VVRVAFERELVAAVVRVAFMSPSRIQCPFSAAVILSEWEGVGVG
jgi:hypothetical protein